MFGAQPVLTSLLPSWAELVPVRKPGDRKNVSGLILRNPGPLSQAPRPNRYLITLDADRIPAIRVYANLPFIIHISLLAKFIPLLSKLGGHSSQARLVALHQFLSGLRIRAGVVLGHQSVKHVLFFDFCFSTRSSGWILELYLQRNFGRSTNTTPVPGGIWILARC